MLTICHMNILDKAELAESIHHTVILLSAIPKLVTYQNFALILKLPLTFGHRSDKDQEDYCFDALQQTTK